MARDRDVDPWAVIDKQRQAMARMEAMIQQLVGGPLAPANGGPRNHPRMEPPPMVSRNRPYVDDNDDESEEETPDARENQLQGRNQPEFAYNQSTSQTMGTSPYEMGYG
ncbi:hypothetical protein DKX38_017456 [Salix brachista]|uniref:Uncharacterized protein n=1 Tax=Salix brachista TaxID=2182728 RepID=A0A5N5KV98_9ROSI|nr:hypothetical protein DKX38_017456 [Salix brachista]